MSLLPWDRVGARENCGFSSFVCTMADVLHLCFKKRKRERKKNPTSWQTDWHSKSEAISGWCNFSIATTQLNQYLPQNNSSKKGYFQFSLGEMVSNGIC